MTILHRNFAAVLTVLVLVFMLAGFYSQPDFTQDQRVTMVFCRAMLGGLVSAYLGGRVALRYGLPRTGTLAVSTTGGIAVFLLLLYHQPYFDRGLVEHCREAAPKIDGRVVAPAGPLGPVSWFRQTHGDV